LGRVTVAALFGGSFNPPHVSHVLATTYALSIHEVDRVLLVPVHRHVFGKELAPFDHRIAMCRLAMGWIPGVEISDIERELGGESRTLHTIEALLARDPSQGLRLLIGSDVLADVPKWYRWDRVAELAPPIVMGRAGYERGDAPAPVLPEISSTLIRERLAAGGPDAVADVVPRSVRAYIAEHGLYR
jgi:nicotinate-nucleotide adenylyltransferase